MSNAHRCEDCLDWYVSDSPTGKCWNCQKMEYDEIRRGAEDETERIEDAIEDVKSNINALLDEMLELQRRRAISESGITIPD